MPLSPLGQYLFTGAVIIFNPAEYIFPVCVYTKECVLYFFVFTSSANGDIFMLCDMNDKKHLSANITIKSLTGRRHNSALMYTSKVHVGEGKKINQLVIGRRKTGKREKMPHTVSAVLTALGSRLSVLGSRLSALGSRFSVLGSRFSRSISHYSHTYTVHSIHTLYSPYVRCTSLRTAVLFFAPRFIGELH